MKSKKEVSIIKAMFFPAFIIAVAALGLYTKKFWYPFLENPDILRNYIDLRGVAGPLVFIGIQIIQVVIFVIPGEITQAAAGYIFGIVNGALYSIIGILIGSVFNFYVARWLGVKFVQRIVPKEQFIKFEGLLATPRMITGFFLFFLIPGIPKDALCYFAGLSPLPLPLFILFSMIGRFPGILGSSIIGASVAQDLHWVAYLMLGVSALLFVAALLMKTHLHRWIGKIAGIHHNVRD